MKERKIYLNWEKKSSFSLLFIDNLLPRVDWPGHKRINGFTPILSCYVWTSIKRQIKGNTRKWWRSFGTIFLLLLWHCFTWRKYFGANSVWWCWTAQMVQQTITRQTNKNTITAINESIFFSLYRRNKIISYWTQLLWCWQKTFRSKHYFVLWLRLLWYNLKSQ